jgi:cytochrome c2
MSKQMKIKGKLFITNERMLILVLLLTVSSIQFSYSQSPGETSFNQICKACHTIGGGRLVGPDLMNVQERRSEEWIVSFVKSSQSMINSGDSAAVAIFEEYNKTPMPDQPLSDTQIADLLNYIIEQSSANGNIAVKPVASSGGMTLDQAGEYEYMIGKDLFTGKERLKNNGAACISCHNVVNDEIISGGLLAKDLTKAFTRLSAAGVNTIISNPPFPVMRSAYTDKPLTQDEAFYLTAFLKQADVDSANQHYVAYQESFALSGLIGIVTLFLLFGGIWWNRKRKPVNDKIFKRQLKTH